MTVKKQLKSFCIFYLYFIISCQNPNTDQVSNLTWQPNETVSKKALSIFNDCNFNFINIRDYSDPGSIYNGLGNRLITKWFDIDTVNIYIDSQSYLYASLVEKTQMVISDFNQNIKKPFFKLSLNPNSNIIISRSDASVFEKNYKVKPDQIKGITGQTFYGNNTSYDLYSLNKNGVVKIWLTDTYTPYFDELLRHELGHSVGLGHTKVQDSFMYPILNNSYPSQLLQHDQKAIQILYDYRIKVGAKYGDCESVLKDLLK